MSFGGSGKSLAQQQFEQLWNQFDYLENNRFRCSLFASIPAAGWGIWGVVGALAMGDPLGAGIIVLITVVTIGGLFIPQTIVKTLALACAFMLAFMGWAYPFLFGGWILMGWITVALVVAGVRACWSVIQNDTEISRTRERLEELAPQVGRSVPWKRRNQPAEGASEEIEVAPGWDEKNPYVKRPAPPKLAPASREAPLASRPSPGVISNPDRATPRGKATPPEREPPTGAARGKRPGS